MMLVLVLMVVLVLIVAMSVLLGDLPNSQQKPGVALTLHRVVDQAMGRE